MPILQQQPASLRRSGKRALMSLVAFVMGWPVGTFVFVGLSVARGDATQNFWIASVAVAAALLVFGAPVWLLAMLPVTLAVPPSSLLCHTLRAPLFGAACGVGALVIEASVTRLPFEGNAVPLCAAAAFGAAAWSTFALFVRRLELVPDQAAISEQVAS